LLSAGFNSTSQHAEAEAFYRLQERMNVTCNLPRMNIICISLRYSRIGRLGMARPCGLVSDTGKCLGGCKNVLTKVNGIIGVVYSDRSGFSHEDITELTTTPCSYVSKGAVREMNLLELREMNQG
jgi:hypothetical protein